MLERLSSVEEKYEELNKLLADPEVVTDHTKVQQYAKEQSVMREVVELAREYREVIKEISDLRDMLRSESDPDILSLVKDEHATLEGKKEEAEERLRMALVPKDPNDDKNVIIEIRAGTGGEETGCIPGWLSD